MKAISAPCKRLYLVLLMAFSQSIHAGNKDIIPADHEKIYRSIGEPVLVECRKQSPFSSECQVDCGNGRHFRRSKGYCFYQSAGIFLLNVSARYRNRNYTHRAVVSVSNDASNERRFSKSKAFIEKNINPSKQSEARFSQTSVVSNVDHITAGNSVSSSENTTSGMVATSTKKELFLDSDNKNEDILPRPGATNQTDFPVNILQQDASGALTSPQANLNNFTPEINQNINAFDNRQNDSFAPGRQVSGSGVVNNAAISNNQNQNLNNNAFSQR